MGENIFIRVKRFDPEKGEGYWATYDIPRNLIEGMTVIAALKYIRENREPSLAFYYSCELAQCRSCLMEIDGEVAFACTEPVHDGQNIAPFANLPVMRDLVVKFIESELTLNEKICTGCGQCVNICPMDIYEMLNSGKAAVRNNSVKTFCGHMVDCIGCKRCEEICPVEAIEVHHKKKFS